MLSLLDKWVQENNELANNFKLPEAQEATSPDQNRTNLRQSCSEFHKLLRKIQGIPPDAGHAELELSVVYNASVCFIAQSQIVEAELLLQQATERVLQMTGDDPDTSDPLVLWRTVLKSVRKTAFHHHVLYLLSLQWAIWLTNSYLKTIRDFQEEISALLETLSGKVGDDCRNETKAKFPDVPKLITDPRRLVELLQICTIITQERLSEGWSSEVLSDLQAASTLPAARALVAYTHLLSGACLAHMNRPQMALQCYKTALETDSHCVCALYQSILIYRQLKNSQAEIQTLRILHSVSNTKILLLPSSSEPAMAGTHLLSPSLFLRSQSLSSLLSVPSALSVLHSLALKCVLHSRASEGVEHYLDLLAALHSEDQHRIGAKTMTDTQVHAEVSTLPKLPRLYLEAGAALLMAQRPADCMALCSEVISTTQDLLPQKVVLDESETNAAATEDVKEEGEGGLAMFLWTAAAYLLQGHCFTHMKDWKQAVTHYTRCINLLVKVHYKNKVAGFQTQIPSADTDVQQGGDFCILQRLKGLSFAGRGISFTQMDRMKEALRDLQHSLQVLPEGVGAGLWCGEVLWRLSRRCDAAACWEKTWSLPTQPLTETLPVYVQEPQTGPLLDSTELRHRLHELHPV
ncbi:Fanconi anemia group G protein isoform X3 [Kryptolebias marmoratus]|uniref:Fanconi anemia group G protein isoform X3 n=1 Tax=Kryptolebias marmoratus TaxID=37003 RepID=UPI0007F8FFB7|nr:Fanconi anemia group G protein isoform X3 [Kryptolebias marmoratus]